MAGMTQKLDPNIKLRPEGSQAHPASILGDIRNAIPDPSQALDRVSTT
jgi:hypothetical protein